MSHVAPVSRSAPAPRRLPPPLPINRIKRIVPIAAAAAAAVMVAACATPLPPPTEQLVAAAAVVAHAAGSGGNDFAPQEMRLARDKMLRAEAAMVANDYALALRMSREAQEDAQLAEAKAESAKARQAARSATESNRVLSEEIQRKTP